LAVVTKVNAGDDDDDDDDNDANAGNDDDDDNDANDDDDADANDGNGDDDEGGGVWMRVGMGMRRTPLPTHGPSEVGFMSRFEHRLWAYAIDG
jgi:hypothetical protein